MKYHLKSCLKNSNGSGPRQQELHLQPIAGKHGEGNLVPWKFDQQAIRMALARMVIIDELPFKFVEGEGFKQFMNIACPRFIMPSRWTTARDIVECHDSEKLKLKNYFKNAKQRVCLTTDTWTSIQRINYMCLTAHYIDVDWNLVKNIINFCPIDSHKGEAIGRAVEECLLHWGIDKVFTITVDNASSNDVAIEYLKKKTKKNAILGAEFLHMRCMAHIVNLVVVDGLKEKSVSVDRIRGAIKYIRQSPARLQKFKKCVEIEKLESKQSLCLDVSTRWNSTYTMLDVALKLQLAFDRYDELDHNYFSELCAGSGRPTNEDWQVVSKLVTFLRYFYELTKRISGSYYTTSNNFFHEMCSLHCLLDELMESSDLELSVMAKKMKEKYDKYFGNVVKMNMLTIVAAILDPRHKMGFVLFALEQMYPGEVGVQMKKKVQDLTSRMFEEYRKMVEPQDGSASKSKDTMGGATSEENVNQQPAEKMKMLMVSRYKKFRSEIGGEDAKSELDKYLGEEVEDDHQGFNILKWWKDNGNRFPIVANMARDVLAFPISTVASESAFSTGGRVLDPFRSSLTPAIVENLVCTQDWLRGSHEPVNVEEKLEDIEKIEKGIYLL